MENGAAAFGSLLDRELLVLPDPGRALVHLDRILEAAFNPASLLELLTKHPRMFAELLRLITASVWLTDSLVRDAELLRWLLLEADTGERRYAAMLSEARITIDRFETVAGRVRALRRFQRRELLRIASEDLLGRRELPGVLRELSALADIIVALAWKMAVGIIEKRNDLRLPCPVSVIALGKLGGEELNYSSDIDLMVVYSENTEIGHTTTHDLVTAAVAEFVHILSDQTPEGQLYRTDLRLRPDGAAGPTAISHRAALQYYEMRGADWERQMLLRARVCAGDSALGNALLNDLRPFVLPRTLRRLPSEVFSDVMERLRERWSRDGDVKHMHGGIRHIEFTLQALQRIHGGADGSVCTPSTLKSLDALSAGGYVTAEEHALLRRAYLFLRRVEHAVMIDRFEQTHTLPADSIALARIAWLLGFDTAGEFGQRLKAVREDVASICAVLAGGSAKIAPPPGKTAATSFADTEASRQLIRDLTDGRGGKGRESVHRERLRALLPVLLEEIAGETLPDTCLSALENLLHRSNATGEIVALFEQARSRQVLLRLASLAPVQLRSFDADPLALELMLGGWDEHLDDQRLKRVAETSALVELFTGSIDIAGYGRKLSHTADVIISRHIQDSDTGNGLAVLAMGKYGSRELIPGSDLDVVFLHDDEQISSEMAQSAASAILRGMMQAGYAVDARLRPEGGSAPLSISLNAWLEYMNRRASLWEKQSLLRARAVGGSATLNTRIDALVDKVLGVLRLTAADVRTIDAMRRKMEPENRFHRQDFFDVKRSPGGLVDVEFAWQVHCLSLPPEHRIALRAGIMKTESVRDEAAPLFARLREHYDMLRALQLRFRLLIDTPSNLFPGDAEQQALLARAGLYADVSEYLRMLQLSMQQARRDYEAALAHVAATLD